MMRILRMGSIGPAVALLQLALNRKGSSAGLAQDGIFGPATEAALRRFQQERGLNPDGVAGRETHRALTPWYTGYLVHTIRRGDTLWALAERYATSLEAIRLANPGVREEHLEIGAGLVVPLGFAVVPDCVPFFSNLTGYCVRGLAARYPFLFTGEIGRSVLGSRSLLVLLSSLGSFLGSLGSLGLGSCFGGCNLGFLLSHGLGLGLVLLGFLVKTFLVVGLLGLNSLVLHCRNFGIFLSFPSLETLLSLCLVEGAFLHAALEMLHEHDTLAREDVAHSVGGDCAAVDPVESSLEI